MVCVHMEREAGYTKVSIKSPSTLIFSFWNFKSWTTWWTFGILNFLTSLMNRCDLTKLICLIKLLKTRKFIESNPQLSWPFQKKMFLSIPAKEVTEIVYLCGVDEPHCSSIHYVQCTTGLLKRKPGGATRDTVCSALGIWIRRNCRMNTTINWNKENPNYPSNFISKSLQESLFTFEWRSGWWVSVEIP